MVALSKSLIFRVKAENVMKKIGVAVPIPWLAKGGN